MNTNLANRGIFASLYKHPIDEKLATSYLDMYGSYMFKLVRYMCSFMAFISITIFLLVNISTLHFTNRVYVYVAIYKNN